MKTIGSYKSPGHRAADARIKTLRETLDGMLARTEKSEKQLAILRKTVDGIGTERDEARTERDELRALVEERVEARRQPKPDGWAKNWTKRAIKVLAGSHT